MKSIFYASLLFLILYVISISCAEEENLLPYCNITSPLAGDEIEIGSTIAITANAYDRDGTISKVIFFIDGDQISSVSNSPYTLQWNTSYEYTGTHELRAVAEDDQGMRKPSHISVTIVEPEPDNGGGGDGYCENEIWVDDPAGGHWQCLD
jgi:chitinase